MAGIDREAFFARVRASLFEGVLTALQASGLSALLDEWAAAHAGQDARWLAYMLSTAHHETARGMQPIREFGLGRRRAYGKADPATGQHYYGRGFVQLTWDYNYKSMGARLGLGDALYREPNRALEPAIATKILFTGMIEGLFTGKKLADYFSAGREDWTNARRIINGTDRASLIAGYGRKYLAAIGGGL